MRRLGGVDAAFLGMESTSVFLHVVAVSVYDPSTSPHTFDAEHAQRLLLSKIDQIPVLRQKLATVPGSFARPYWVDDPDFDITRHVFEHEVAAPGGREQLADAISAICETALDRRKPMWEMHVLTGIEGGLVAHALKLHHAAVDGATGVAITRILNSTDPDDVEIGPAVPWHPDPAAPSSLNMLRRGVEDTATTAKTLVGLGGSIVAMVPGVVRWVAGGKRPRLRTVPRVSFSSAITSRRAVAYTELDFATVRSISKATGTTINDVVLTTCAIALREWLARRGELPTKALLAGVPVSTREEGGSDDANQVTAVMTALPVHIADPMEVLRVAAEDMRLQKQTIGLAPGDLTERMTGLLPPVSAGLGSALLEVTRMMDRVPGMFNLSVSNVPGARVAQYCTGARLLRHFGFGFLTHGSGLNITLDSRITTFDVSLMACPDQVDNVWDLADAMPRALDVLAAAAL